MLERHAERLGLDEATQVEITRLAEASRTRDRELQQELRALHDRMRKLLAAPSPDEAEVVALAEEIGRTENAAYKLRLQTMLRIRALLTPEQLAELVAIEEGTRGRHERTLEAACADELASLCPDIPRGHETFECLRRHRDALSPECSKASRPPHHRGRPPRPPR